MIDIILISGKKGHGKDTVGSFIKDCFNEKDMNSTAFIHPRNFADPLKEIGGKLFGLSVEQLHRDKKEVIDGRYQLTPRQILQGIGKSMREIYKDIWVKVFCDKIYSLSNLTKDATYKVFVNTDTRYPNEITFVQDYFSCINLTRIIKVRVINPRIQPNEFSNHESETSLDNWTDWDYIIINDGSLEDLQDKVRTLTEDLW